MGLQPPPAEYRGPSWSWASKEGFVRHWEPMFSSQRIRWLADIISAETITHPSDTTGTGQISAASMEIAAPMRKVRSPHFSKWSNIKGLESVHVLHEEGVEIGRFNLDLMLISEQTQQICLLPLLIVLPHIDQGQHANLDTEPEWQEICGLVLLAPPNHEIPPYYERIGFFKFYCKSPDFHLIKMFDELDREKVTIR